MRRATTPPPQEEVRQASEIEEQNEWEVVQERILNSPEFTFCFLSLLLSNVSHNDHNIVQNNQAEGISERLVAQKPGLSFSKKIVESVGLSTRSKKSDQKISLVGDLTRMAFSAVSLAAVENEAKGNAEESLESAKRSADIISVVMQGLFAITTSFYGYRAAITGHLVNEKADSLEKITKKIAGTDPATQDSHHHAGSKQRHLGSLLNLISISSGFVRAIDQLQKQSGQTGLMDDRTSAIIGVSAPFLTIFGKLLSRWAAEIRDVEVKNKIDEFNNYLKSTGEAYKRAENKEEFIDNTLREYVRIGREAEKEMEEQRKKTWFGLRFSKYFINNFKDLVYGASFRSLELFNWLNSEILSVFTYSSANAQITQGGAASSVDPEMGQIRPPRDIADKFAESKRIVDERYPRTMTTGAIVYSQTPPTPTPAPAPDQQKNPSIGGFSTDQVPRRP